MKPYNTRTIIIITVPIIMGMGLTIYILNQPVEASIYDYLPYITGVVSIAVGLYFALLSFGIYKPKYKSEAQQVRVDDLVKKHGKSMKFGSIFLILYGLYNLILHDPDMYRLNSRVEAARWTNRDKAKFITDCLKIAGPKLKNHDHIALEYCTCAIDKIMKEMNKNQYIDDLSMPKRAQDDKFDPVFDGCAINLKQRVDSAEKTK